MFAYITVRVNKSCKCSTFNLYIVYKYILCCKLYYTRFSSQWSHFVLSMWYVYNPAALDYKSYIVLQLRLLCTYWYNYIWYLLFISYLKINIYFIPYLLIFLIIFIELSLLKSLTTLPGCLFCSYIFMPLFINADVKILNPCLGKVAWS